MGFRDLKSCCLSHGQPSGPRSVAIIWTSLSNFAPVMLGSAAQREFGDRPRILEFQNSGSVPEIPSSPHYIDFPVLHSYRMKVVSSLADAALSGPSVLSIGNFDGLHLGHRAILERVVQRAHELGLRPTAMTFDPHPSRVLAPDKAPKLIGALEQRLRLIEQTGIELTFVAAFDQAFARLSPEAFIQRYIVEGFHTRTICVGSNFNFGSGGRGTVETLRLHRGLFEVLEVPP